MHGSLPIGIAVVGECGDRGDSVAQRLGAAVRNLRRLLWVMFTLVLAKALPIGVAHAGTVLIDETFEEVSLGKYLDVAYDPTGELTVDDVRSGKLQFTPSTKDVPTFGFRRGAEWARFTLRDSRAQFSDLAVQLQYAPTDEFDVFVVRNGAARHLASLGDHRPRPREFAASRRPTSRVPSSDGATVYLRLAGDASHQLPLRLMSNARAADAIAQDAFRQALYFGAILSILAYNALLFVGTRIRVYRTYAMFLFAWMLSQAAFSGVLTLLFDTRGEIADRSLPVAMGVTFMLGLTFAAELLSLGSFLARHARFRELLVVGGGAMVMTGLFQPYATAMHVGLTGVAVWVVTMIFFGIKGLSTEPTTARVYLAAWTALLLGLFYDLMVVLGRAPSLLSGAQQIGSTIEFILLSFALADRIKQLQQEVTVNANIAREASERALAEQERANNELQRIDKLKDEFLANTSHELRTPLHGMLGLTEAVLQGAGDLDTTSRERLGMVVASGRRLSSLVSDILDFSKLRHQSIALREKNHDVHDAVALALSVVAPMAASKGVELRSEVPRDVFVHADENRVQQILTNLLGNAVKFTARGEVVVRADVRESRVFVSVHDTGVGIPQEAQARIFESFEQADGSTSREYGGTGLGLAVTKQLVELHGGRIAVDSAPGKGSTFTFDLARADRSAESVAAVASNRTAANSVILRAASPLAGVEHGQASVASAAASVASSLATGASGHVLIADDDPVNVEVLRAQLEPAGYTVTAARDGAEAVAALQSLEHVDGVLLDVMMPKMTGVQAAEKIRELHPHGTLPILMLTAKSRPEDVVVGMRAGASDYIGKPFHREELLQRVDAHVQAVKTARAFRRFVPEDFLGLLGVERFDALRAGIGQQHEVTILFADVRNFTTRSETLGPEGTFRFINGCLERFEPVVRQHGGFVDKFIGDAVMAIFPRDQLDAAKAAEGLHREVASFNAARPDAKMPLAIGVGVHRGRVILGTVGGADRMEVTAIGDAVNVAARLESLTKGLGAGAVVSEEVLSGRPHDARRVGAVHVKGRAAPVELFELLACCSSDLERQQKETTSERFQRGLRAYAQGDMARAREHFESCVNDAPLDRTAAIYLERSTAYAERGVPEGFDGCLDGV